MKTPNKKELNRWLAEKFLGWEIWAPKEGYTEYWARTIIEVDEEDFFNLEGRELIENELLLRGVPYEIACYPKLKRKFHAKIETAPIQRRANECKYTAFYRAIWAGVAQ